MNTNCVAQKFIGNNVYPAIDIQSSQGAGESLNKWYTPSISFLDTNQLILHWISVHYVHEGYNSRY